MSESQTALLRDACLVGLLVECPLIPGNPPACPIHAKRHRPLCERYKWAKGLTLPEAEGVLTMCDSCALVRRS